MQSLGFSGEKVWVMAPEKRLRCKTPDPCRRHKSPDPKALRKAEQHVKVAKKAERSRGSSEPTARRLTFDGVPKVTPIVAENTPGERRPGDALPETRRSSKGGKMTSAEADKILAKFAREKELWCWVANGWGILPSIEHKQNLEIF